jgi:glycosyltransferase 2 family protein
VLLLYSLVILFFRGWFFLNRIPHFTLIFIAGLIANSFMISLYALFIFKKRIAAKILFFGINLLGRLKIVKKPFKYKKYLIKEVKMFSEGAVILGANPILLVKTVIFHAGRLTFFFSIPFFIFLAIEGTTANLFNMICSQAIVAMTASYVPLPGASGGAEGIGYLFFKLFFRKNILVSVILIWRLLTYYTNIIFGGLFTLLTPDNPLKKRAG